MAIVATVVLLIAAPASAADGGVRQMLWQALNLAILLAVVVYFARKPLQNFFAERRDQIRGDLDEAARLYEEAENRNREWQRKLADLQREVDQIRVDGRRRAEEDREAILAEAEAAAERIHRDAAAAVDHELRRAQGELRKEAALLATELAERILRERIGDADRERLIDEFITRVEPTAGQS